MLLPRLALPPARTRLAAAAATTVLLGAGRTYAAAAAAGAAAGDDALAIARATRPGQPAPSLLPFSVAPAAALAAFTAFQKAACFNLHSSNLLSAGHSLEPRFLPFWLFEAEVSSEAIATLGRRVDSSAGTRAQLVWTKMAAWRPVHSHQLVPRSDPCMQVYASYELRRDLAEAAKMPGLCLEAAAAAVPLSRQDLERRRHPDPLAASAAAAHVGSMPGSQQQQQPPDVPLEVPAMRQAIAWQLCHRQLMHAQICAAAEQLKSELAADEVNDLKLRLTVHRRSARLAYLPAWHLSYVHGERYTPSRADIVPAEYDAVIGGTTPAAAAGAPPGGGSAGAPAPRVAAELHPSPIKSQAAAVAAVTGVGLGVMPLTSLALGLDPALLSMAGADAALLAVLAASGAGALASRLPLIARNRHAAAQAAADRSFYKQYDQRETAYSAPPDEHTLWLWRDADWRKWERDEPWSWSPDKRRVWAESLFSEQKQRDIDRVAATKQQEQLSRQREQDEARDAKRQTRHGRGRRAASAHAHDEAGTRVHHDSGHPHHRRRRDFLGYYKALGINLEEAAPGPITAEFIKASYKAAVLKLHPDRHVHADEATQRRSAERFRRLQLAYETLRDAEKRRAYDAGRLVH